MGDNGMIWLIVGLLAFIANKLWDWEKERKEERRLREWDADTERRIAASNRAFERTMPDR